MKLFPRGGPPCTPLWRLLLFVGLTAWVFPAAAAQPAHLLVDRIENPTELVEAAGQRWLRSRPVSINPEALQALSSGNTDSLRFETFDGKSYVLRLTRKSRFPNGGEIWSGEATGLPGTDVQLVFTGQHVSLSANLPSQPPIALRTVGTDQYRLCEIDLTQGDGCGVVHSGTPVTNASPHRATKSPSVRPASAETEFMLIDVAILYTPAARVSAGGKAAIEAEAYKSVNSANEVHDNSKTFVHLRLVALNEISFTEKATINEDLAALAANNQATNIMNASGADLVSLFVERTGGANGLAYTPEKTEQIGTGIFSVVKWDHAYSGLTFAHETGHGFGAGHYDAETPLFPYSRGYLMKGGLYRTVMASDPTGFLITRVKHYSNPDVSYVDAFNVPYLTGDRATADNARTIRETKQITRAAKKPSFYASYVPQGNVLGWPAFLFEGEGSELSPSTHLEYLFGAVQPGFFGTTRTIPSVITLVGIPSDEPAEIRLDPARHFNEKITISRPCILMNRGNSPGSVVIGAP